MFPALAGSLRALGRAVTCCASLRGTPSSSRPAWHTAPSAPRRDSHKRTLRGRPSTNQRKRMTRQVLRTHSDKSPITSQDRTPSSYILKRKLPHTDEQEADVSRRIDSQSFPWVFSCAQHGRRGHRLQSHGSSRTVGETGFPWTQHATASAKRGRPVSL